ncbi:PAS domain-containing protein [bacterium]|nr:PAS domain-containing protein [bacterium]
MLVVGVNLSGEIFEVNNSFLELFKLEKKEIYGKRVGDLIRNADIAMYNAKRLGGNNYQFYSNIMEA